MPPINGYKVVLTADDTLMASYNLLFDGMLAASQTTSTPALVMKTLLMPRGQVIDGKARFAPLGLRRIEAALLQAGFTSDEVAVVPSCALEHAIGPATQIVGISGGEPVGGGMNSSTMVGIAGGTIYPLAMCRKLMTRVEALRRQKAPKAKLIFGGPGAWQLIQHDDARIDHIVSGYAEGNIGEVFRDLCDGKSLPKVIQGVPVEAEDIPQILGASIMGGVEVSRGCGLGCSFCTISHEPMRHLPIDSIVRDVRTNIEAGQTNIAALSEDFFRYGAKGIKPNPKVLLTMLEAVRNVEGLGLIQIDHASIVGISQYADSELRDVHALLTRGVKHDYLWLNLGVETAVGELLAANGGRAKIGQSDPSEWADKCRREIERLCEVGFFPMVSLVMGMPGETQEHVRRTLDFVKSLRGLQVSVFPMILAPLDGSIAPTGKDLTPLHWDLIKEAYRFNFKWVPKMYWDNQCGGGVPLSKRVALQMLGRGQVVEWKALFELRKRLAR